MSVMDAPGPVPPNRLDSWKAIADYLKRDLATVRRWEKTRGLPVRRVSGNGRSVFAYASEIDAWLNGAGSAEPAPVEAGPSLASSIAGFRGWAMAALVLLVVVAGATSVAVRMPALTAADLRIHVTPDGVFALDTAGRQRWQHLFPPDYATVPLQIGEPWRVVSGANPAVYVATSHRARRADSFVEGGELLSLNINGAPTRSFSFDDRVTLGGVPFGAPWAIIAFAVDDGGRQVAVAAHHFQWEPSLVTVLDETWRRRGTFVHAGWIEAASWLAPDRLLIAGFSNAHDGGMVGMLDPAALDGQGPESPGSPFYCDGCGRARPVRMAILPRSEINRVTQSPFNRAIVQISAGRVIVRTIEVPSANPADALYEFSPALDLVRASFSARYWEVHRALEAKGTLTHSRDTCPEREGPREIQLWEPRAGWKTIKASAAPGAPRMPSRRGSRQGSVASVGQQHQIARRRRDLRRRFGRPSGHQHDGDAKVPEHFLDRHESHWCRCSFTNSSSVR